MKTRGEWTASYTDNLSPREYALGPLAWPQSQYEHKTGKISAPAVVCRKVTIFNELPATMESGNY